MGMIMVGVGPPDNEEQTSDADGGAVGRIRHSVRCLRSPVVSTIAANAMVASLGVTLLIGVVAAQQGGGGGGLCAFPGGEPVLSNGGLIFRGILGVVGIVGVANPSSGGDGSYGGMDSGRLKRLGAAGLIALAALLPQILTYVLGWFDSSMAALGLGCVF